MESRNEDKLFPTKWKPVPLIVEPFPEDDDGKETEENTPEIDVSEKIAKTKPRNYLPGGNTDITSRENHSKTQKSKPDDKK